MNTPTHASNPLNEPMKHTANSIINRKGEVINSTLGETALEALQNHIRANEGEFDPEDWERTEKCLYDTDLVITAMFAERK